MAGSPEHSKYKRVVVLGVDQSVHSEFCLEWYMDNLHRPSDKVILVHAPEMEAHVTRNHIVASADYFKQVLTEQNAKVKELQEKLDEKLRKRGIDSEFMVGNGKPGEAIISAATTVKANMIIVGSRGMGTIRRTLLGSVSDFVLHHAYIPVTICKHPKHIPF